MKGIDPKDIEAGLKEHVFWYVYDENTQQVITVPDDQANEYVAILFQEKKDAETWKFVLSKSVAHQDHKLRVDGDKFQSIYEDSLEHQEFKLLAFSPEEASKFFEAYKDILLTRDFEESRDLQKDD